MSLEIWSDAWVRTWTVVDWGIWNIEMSLLVEDDICIWEERNLRKIQIWKFRVRQWRKGLLGFRVCSSLRELVQ